MDWALVLASQGINALIDDGADGAGWGLVVMETDYPAAMKAIRLYRRENRHWRWRPTLPGSSMVFDWRVVFWVLLMAGFYWFSMVARPYFSVAGRMDNAAVLAGQWWRIFTAILLHANPAHLAANLSVGTILLGLAMGRFGAGIGLLATFLAGALGNLAGLLLYSPSHLGVGASGMVMGGLGMLAAQSLKQPRHDLIARKNILRSLAAGLLLFVFFGTDPHADIVAHLGGFIGGLLFGIILLRLPAAWRNTKTDLAALLGFAGLVMISSWLALHAPALH